MILPTRDVCDHLSLYGLLVGKRKQHAHQTPRRRNKIKESVMLSDVLQRTTSAMIRVFW